MARLDHSFDYLALLDLQPADVARLGPAALREHLRKKKKELTAKEINPLYQQAARQSKERLLEFEPLLDDADALAAYVQHLRTLRAEQQRRHEEELRRLVGLAAAGKREISPQQRQLLEQEARDQGIPVPLLAAVLHDLGIAVRAEPSPTARPALPYLAPALDRVLFTEIHNWLRVLGKPTLYALLDLPDAAPPAQLVATAKLLHARWSRVLPKTSECTAWEKTLQACTTYLKDRDGKARYDRALFNQRLDLFVRRIDLVLAGHGVGEAEQRLLLRLGVQDFGLPEKAARDCLLARAAEKGVSLAASPVKVDLQGQIQCRRCFAWSDGRVHERCRCCGAALQQACANPGCRRTFPADASVCPHCTLPVARSRQYLSLLELADLYLERGNVKAAQDACALAAQVLPGPEVERRQARAGQMRVLLASVQEGAARKAWSKVFPELQQLVALAPRLRQEGVPRLEAVAAHMASARAQLRALAPDEDPVAAARVCLAWLAQWTDCDEIYQRLRQLCQALEDRQDPRAALQLTRKLLVYRPDDGELAALATRLEATARQGDLAPRASP